MSVTVKCAISGLEFEAETRRTKKHPIVTAMESACAKREWREFKQSSEAVRKAGGYTTAEEFCKLVRQHINDGYHTSSVAFMAQQAEQKAADDARKATRAALKAAGYTTRIVDVQTNQWATDYDDEVWATETEWVAPDGQPIEYSQAVDAIKHGLDAIRAQERAATESREASARQEEQDKIAREHADTEYRVGFEAQAKSLTAGMVKVEPPQNKPEITILVRGRSNDFIGEFMLDVQKYVVVNSGSDFDFDGWLVYYTAAPTQNDDGRTTVDTTPLPLSDGEVIDLVMGFYQTLYHHYDYPLERILHDVMTTLNDWQWQIERWQTRFDDRRIFGAAVQFGATDTEAIAKLYPDGNPDWIYMPRDGGEVIEQQKQAIAAYVLALRDRKDYAQRILGMQRQIAATALDYINSLPEDYTSERWQRATEFYKPQFERVIKPATEVVYGDDDFDPRPPRYGGIAEF